MIQVQDSTKVRLARSGANKLYDVDFDSRRDMRDNELIRLFDRVWAQGLESLVVHAEPCTSEEAARRLADKYHDFIDPTQEQRSFRYKKAEFIAQLRHDADNHELTQLWRVFSSDTHPKTLFLTFDSVEERESVRELAERLKWNDEKLGLTLLRNFMAINGIRRDEAV